MYNSGDILLYETTAPHWSNILAQGIRLVVGNKVIHVAVYICPFQDKHIILEALDGGVFVKVISDIINRDNGLHLYGIASLPDITFNTEALLTVACNYDSCSYGYLTDINILFQHGKCLLFPKLPWTIWFKSKNGFICSEIAQIVLKILNPALTFPKIPALTEPNDYLVAPWTVKKV